MKAIIEIDDVPDYQIGKMVQIYFPDSMQKHGKCELMKKQEAVKMRYTAMGGLRYGACPHCDARVDNLVNPKACGFCGQELKWG